MAGWMRTVGHVTAVVMGSEHASESAPITDQTNGLWPCSSFHGWKWSLIHRPSNPAASAARAWATSSAGPYSSQDRKYPIFITSTYPRRAHATACAGYPTLAMSTVRVGISGWRYPGWRGDFYPRGLPQRRELEYAA